MTHEEVVQNAMALAARMEAGLEGEALSDGEGGAIIVNKAAMLSIKEYLDQNKK